MGQLNIAYLGNFEPEHSTENHVRQAAERRGHTVQQLQENNVDSWFRLTDRSFDADMGIWTRTGWDWPHLTGWSWEEATQHQTRALEHLAEVGIPTVGFHLDRWWGLDREGQILNEPFFQCDIVCTADGGRQDDWERVGVNHVWLPPGVSLAECEREPEPRGEYARQSVTWVGSWQHYHPEWLPYRRELIRQLKKRYRRELGLYPRRGQGIRGKDLTDLYNATKVVVGDSCLSGDATHYWSDRIPETLGRGGFLIHPNVVGLETHFTPGVHLATYDLWDWDGLLDTIDRFLLDETTRNEIRHAGREHVMTHHTYERRIDQVVDLVAAL